MKDFIMLIKQFKYKPKSLEKETVTGKFFVLGYRLMNVDQLNIQLIKIEQRIRQIREAQRVELDIGNLDKNLKIKWDVEDG
jgi:uncharacterized protein YxjI